MKLVQSFVAYNLELQVGKINEINEEIGALSMDDHGALSFPRVKHMEIVTHLPTIWPHAGSDTRPTFRCHDVWVEPLQHSRYHPT